MALITKKLNHENHLQLLKPNGFYKTRSGQGISMRLFVNKPFLMLFFLYWVVMVNECFAQSSSQQNGVLESLGSINASSHTDHSKTGAINAEAIDSSSTIFKENIDRSASSRAWLHDSPQQNFGSQWDAIDRQSSKMGNIDQGFMGPFNTPRNNPKGVSVGIDVPLGDR